MTPIYVIMQSKDRVTWTFAENLQRFYRTEQVAKKRALVLNNQAHGYIVLIHYKVQNYVPERVI